MENVFVYGTLKKGFYNHSVIQSGKFLDKGILSGALMFKTRSFPVLFEGDKKIIGEVYEVNPTVFRNLDRLEGNGSMYLREKKPVTLLTGGDIEAWVYFGMPRYWSFEDGKIAYGSSGITQVRDDNGIQVF